MNETAEITARVEALAMRRKQYQSLMPGGSRFQGMLPGEVTLYVAQLEDERQRLQDALDASERQRQASGERDALAEDPAEQFDYAGRSWGAHELSVLRFLDTGAASAEEMSLMFTSLDLYEHLFDNGYIGYLAGVAGYEITDKGEVMLSVWRQAINAYWTRRFNERVAATAQEAHDD